MTTPPTSLYHDCLATTPDRSESMNPLSDAEIEELSTPEERIACARYKQLQYEAIMSGVMGETALLEASQAIGILAARNKRLGLIS